MNIGEIWKHIDKLHGSGSLSIQESPLGGVIVKPFFDFLKHEVKHENIEEYLLMDTIREVGDTCGCFRIESAMLYMGMLQLAKKRMAAGHSQVDIIKSFRDHCDRITNDLNSFVNTSYSVEELYKGHTHLTQSELKAISGVLECDSHLITITRGIHSEKFKVISREGFKVSTPHIDSFYFHNYGDEFEFVNPVIICLDLVPSLKTLVPVLRYANENDIPLIIMSRELKRETHDAIKTNVTKGALKCIHLTFPTVGEEKNEWLKDLSRIIGVKVINEYTDMSDGFVVEELLGKLKKVTFSKSGTFFTAHIGDYKEVNVIESKIKNDKDLCGIEKVNLIKRMSMLSNEYNEVSVGGLTQIESEYLYGQVLDLTTLVRMCSLYGVVVGGRKLFSHIYLDIPMDGDVKEVFGKVFNIVKKADEQPMWDSFKGIETALTKAFTNAGLAVSEKINVK